MDTELIGFLVLTLIILTILFLRSKFAPVFINSFYQSPDVVWKGIDQNLFENPSYKIPASDFPGPCRCKSGKKEGMCGCTVNKMMDWNNLNKRK